MAKSATSKIHHRACNLCEAICGLKIEVDNGKIVSIKGDPDDPLSRGHICPKAVALQDIQMDPDRLRQPMRRLRDQGDGSEWEAISWDAAFKIVAEGLVSTQQRRGNNALGVYLGNPSVHNYGILTHQGALFSLLRTENRFSATSVDQLPQQVVSRWLYGHKDLLPVPDIDNTDYLLILGGNPIASNGSIWTVPDVRQRIKDLKQRGGKLVVLDPRRTETAKLASKYHAIRPGSDALFLAAVLNVIFELTNDAPKQVNATVEGLAEVRSRLQDFTPECVATATGIAAPDIRKIAQDFVTAGAAACYGRMGVSAQAFGTLNHWLIQLINLVSGNLDKVGGTMFSHPAAFDPTTTRPGEYAQTRSRVSGKPAFAGELPAAAMAEEILTPGEGQIKALFTCAGNPVLSTPNGRQLDRALESLDFMVSLDPYLNETTRHADIILPPTAPLEHDHYDIAFHPMAVRNTSRFNEAIFEKPEGAQHDWEIFTELGKHVAALLGRETRAQQPPAAIIDQKLQSGNYGTASGHSASLSLDKLKAHPSGIDLGPLRPGLPERLLSEDKIIRSDVAACLEDLNRARTLLNPSEDLSLIGRRHVRDNNSWMHNSKRLVKGKSRANLLMHPDDMASRGIEDGAMVCVASRVGSVEIAAEACTDIMPGVVSLPHGYGHDRKGVRMSIAASVEGCSLNDLTDDAASDVLSGTAVLNGTPVEVVAFAARGVEPRESVAVA
jgi:anaerobic selenocysteine-containing dehydrogenase